MSKFIYGPACEARCPAEVLVGGLSGPATGVLVVIVVA